MVVSISIIKYWVDILCALVISKQESFNFGWTLVLHTSQRRTINCYLAPTLM